MLSKLAVDGANKDTYITDEAIFFDSDRVFVGVVCMYMLQEKPQIVSFHTEDLTAK